MVGEHQSEPISIDFPEALPITSLPASNGFQEQIFSVCTYNDNFICKRLGDDNFEESVLLLLNNALGTLKNLSVGGKM